MQFSVQKNVSCNELFITNNNIIKIYHEYVQDIFEMKANLNSAIYGGGPCT